VLGAPIAGRRSALHGSRFSPNLSQLNNKTLEQMVEEIFSSRFVPRTVLVFAPKGGVGKTTIATNLLIAARRHGIDAVGVDFDSQGSFTTWAGRRQEAAQQPSVQVIPAQLDAWDMILPKLGRQYHLTVIDTPPGIDTANMDDWKVVAERCDLILIPTQFYPHSIAMVIGFGVYFTKMGLEAIFVLNQTSHQGRTLLAQAREGLKRYGNLCPVEVPLLMDVARCLDAGLSVAEFPKWPGSAQMQELWSFVAGRLAVRAAAA
jgi:chromosome partitioning protein